MLPTNFRIFAMNLEEANLSGEPQWTQSVDYVRDYALEGGMSVDSLYELTVRLTQDEELYWEWTLDKSRNAAPLERGTTQDWIYSRGPEYCSLIASSDKENAECNGHGDKPSWMDVFIGKWKTLGSTKF